VPEYIAIASLFIVPAVVVIITWPDGGTTNLNQISLNVLPPQPGAGTPAVAVAPVSSYKISHPFPRVNVIAFAHKSFEGTGGGGILGLVGVVAKIFVQ
jgi:hypothetical protein